MDDVWFADGLSREDHALCFSALAIQAGTRPLLIAVARKGENGPRLVLASRALFVLFDAADGEDLSRRLLAGSDPGSKRLAALQGTLPLGGAPRLERLRFLIGPGSEVITFLCRRVRAEDGGCLFVAAALGIRPGLLSGIAPHPSTEPALPALSRTEPTPEDLDRAPTDAQPLPPGGLDIAAIQEALRERWPSRHSLRFLWQSDAGCICTNASPPLADIVGAANADLVGVDLLDLAPRLDPTGRLEGVLRARETWSGIDVAWPLDGESAGVAVGLGAIAEFDAERSFVGYRGYGVVRLNEILAREPLRINAAVVGHAGKVIAFPGKAMSAEDQRAFAALAAELRANAGLIGQIQPPPPGPPGNAKIATAPRDPGVDTSIAATGSELDARSPDVPTAAPSIAPEPTPEAPLAPTPMLVTPEPAPAVSEVATREDGVARNGLAVLDRLSLGLLVSRDNVPIFANRHLLDLTGFADEDALHAAGGMAHLFGGTPANASGAEAVAVRTREGASISATVRLQRMMWDGLPATLLTLHADGRPAPEPAQANPPHAEAEERRELRAILETATDGVVVMDHACEVLSLNRAGEALFGRDRGEVIGKPFLNLFAPHDRDLARDYLEGVKSDPTRSLLNDGREFLVTASQGGPIPVFMTLGRLGPTHDAAEQAEAPRYCALFRDLTHWKKVEGELEDARHTAERASALKSEFLAKVSHEVRTPLNAIIGFAEVIMDERFGPLGSERYKDYLRDIHGSGTHVMSLINDLLDLSKIEAGKMELALDAIDVNGIVAECVAMMQPQASRERVIMRLALAASLPRITADERSLRQIALNLLSNAVKYNEPGGQVIVATQLTESGHVVLRIRDTGPGMSESDIVAALEPFRQLSTSRTPASGVGGTGLGLPLTKALVEANDASLTIRSKVDQGTFVEVSFPPARVLAAD